MSPDKLPGFFTAGRLVMVHSAEEQKRSGSGITPPCAWMEQRLAWRLASVEAPVAPGLTWMGNPCWKYPALRSWLSRANNFKKSSRGLVARTDPLDERDFLRQFQHCNPISIQGQIVPRHLTAKQINQAGGDRNMLDLVRMVDQK